MNKMTGPDTYEYYKAALKYLISIAGMERERAVSIVKAAEEFKRIN